MLDAFEAYYSAEFFKLACAMGIGFILTIGGALLIRRDFNRRTADTPPSFSAGLAYPMMVVGFSVLLISVISAFRAVTTHDFNLQLHKIDPASFLEAELVRMKELDATFQKLLFFDTGFIIFGVYLSLRGVVKKRNFRIGIGVGIALLSALLFGVETLGRSQAKTYTAQLEAQHGVVPPLPAEDGEPDL